MLCRMPVLLTGSGSECSTAPTLSGDSTCTLSLPVSVGADEWRLGPPPDPGGSLLSAAQLAVGQEREMMFNMSLKAVCMQIYANISTKLFQHWDWTQIQLKSRISIQQGTKRGGILILCIQFSLYCIFSTISFFQDDRTLLRAYSPVNTKPKNIRCRVKLLPKVSQTPPWISNKQIPLNPL